jgi:hypothetical protein
VQSIAKEGSRALSSNGSFTGILDAGTMEYNLGAGQQGTPNHYNKFGRPPRAGVGVGVANNHMMISGYNAFKEIAPVFVSKKPSETYTRTNSEKDQEKVKIFPLEERSWSRDPFAAEDEIYQMRMKSLASPGLTENESQT